MSPGGVPQTDKIVQALKDYAQLIGPWARSVASAMIADVYRRDKGMWKKASQELGAGIRKQLDNAPVGTVFAELQDQQVSLIKSLPLEAAKRVHELTAKSLVDGRRAAEIAKDIQDTGLVTDARARLIARTETARASSNLVQARSQWAGSVGYIWRTSKDLNVRESHDEMEGVYVKWTEPPTLDGLTGHAGTLPNCRCYAEPIFPDDL